MVAHLDLAAHIHLSPVSSRSFSKPPRFLIACRSSSAVAAAVIAGDAAAPPPQAAERTVVRLGLPSKGRMAEETLNLLKSCQLTVRQLNPRQYTADIPQLSNLEVWFQRPKDIVRKLQSGDLDLGIVGFDTVSEYGQDVQVLSVMTDCSMMRGYSRNCSRIDCRHNWSYNFPSGLMFVFLLFENKDVTINEC